MHKSGLAHAIRCRALAVSLLAVSGLAGATSASANFIDTTWVVVGFEGEAWFVDPQDIIGQSQSFEGGFAEGVFYQCEFDGQSSTYRTYSTSDFLANPEFELFRQFADDIGLSSSQVFVHRVTCEGGGDPSRRRVLYPFVTNEAENSAWYLFEGGVFSLSAP